MQEIPKVSIRCLVYNHESFLRQCLDGFVMQKTNFRYEAIVHDDASTDNSSAIIQEYAENHPTIIKPILEKENQYSKGNGSIGRIMKEACSGQYIAMCEGDDYWTDPYKLQKQVDFLESHPDYMMVFHKVDVKKEIGASISVSYDFLETREYTIEDIVNRWCVPTCSMLYRREILDDDVFNKKFAFRDIVTVLCCLTKGRIYCFADTMGVYRLSPTSWTSQDKLSYYKKINAQNIRLLEYFPIFRKDIIYKRWERNYICLLALLKLRGDTKGYNSYKKQYLDNFKRIKYFDIYKLYYKSWIKAKLKRILDK